MTFDLVFSDPHVQPGEDLSRFDWLGRMIVAERPRRVICIGDFSHLDSCSTHQEPGDAVDRKRPTLMEDVKATIEAQRRMWAPLAEDNARHRKHRHKDREHHPQRWLIQGNHEDRFARKVSKDPLGLGSVLDYNTLMRHNEYWDHIVPFKHWVTLGNIQYTHVPHTKMGRPIGGVTAGRRVATQAECHTIYGHSHTMDYSTASLLGANNTVRCALCAPAFMPQNRVDPYAKNTQSGWCYGLLRVREAQLAYGAISFDYLSTDDLEALYG